MSEHKTPIEQIHEMDYEISRLENQNKVYNNCIKHNNIHIEKYIERKASLLNYLNTDTNSINQDKTE